MSQGSMDGSGANGSGFFRFWFAPKDPSTLGFMRIVTGLLALYVLFAYCFDLRAFFGPDAWYPLDMANRDRRERPYVANPLTSWEDDFLSNLVMPSVEERRDAAISFMKSLPDLPSDREAILRYYYRLPDNPGMTLQGMSFIAAMELDPSNRGPQLQAILTATPEKTAQLKQKSTADLTEAEAAEIDIPAFLQRLPLGEERDRAQTAVIRFLSHLPGGENWPYEEGELHGSTLEQRAYILDFLSQNLDRKEKFRQFIKDLPRDAEERHAKIAYLDEWNVDPAQIYTKGIPVWSVWYHVTSPAGMWAVHIGIMVITLLFTVGFCTRITAVLTWMGMLCYIHRSTQLLFGMDAMMSILLLYLMIAPSGAALSVDRLIQRYRIIRASYRRSGGIDDLARVALMGPPKLASAGFVTRMFQIHFCFIYAAGGLAKLKGDTWWNTTAMWYTIANPEFTPINLELYEDMLRGIAGERWLIALICTSGVYFTLFMEISLPFLIWTRLRPYMVMGSAMLHATIGIIMGLSVFSLIMMILVFCYIRPEAVRDRLKGWSGLKKYKLRFRSDDPGQLWRASVAGALDVNGQVTMIDVADDKPPGESDLIEVSGPDNTVAYGPAGLKKLLLGLRLPGAFVTAILGLTIVSVLLAARYLLVPVFM